jgi:hypothetical protein
VWLLSTWAEDGLVWTELALQLGAMLYAVSHCAMTTDDARDVVARYLVRLEYATDE